MAAAAAAAAAARRATAAAAALSGSSRLWDWYRCMCRGLVGLTAGTGPVVAEVAAALAEGSVPMALVPLVRVAVGLIKGRVTARHRLSMVSVVALGNVRSCL